MLMPAVRPPESTVVFVLLLAGCAPIADASTTRPVSPTVEASAAASPSATPERTVAGLHVYQAQRWSVALPTGWEVVAENESGAALAHGDGGVAEILVAPATGLTMEDLQAQRVEEISSTWPGVGEIESDIVQLPAGDALRVTFETELNPGDLRGVFHLYVLEQGDNQYVISVRGSADNDDLRRVAEALAQSFAILD
jgi:hypothetical protein